MIIGVIHVPVVAHHISLISKLTYLTSNVQNRPKGQNQGVYDKLKSNVLVPSWAEVAVSTAIAERQIPKAVLVVS